jgi:hypothetical protein
MAATNWQESCKKGVTCVYMDKIGDDLHGGGGGADNHTVWLGNKTRDQLMAIYSQSASVSQRQAQAEAQTQLYHSRTDSRLDSMDNNICHIAIQPI